MDNKGVRVVNLLPAVALGFGLFIFWGAIQKLAEPLLLIALAVIVAAALNPAVIWAEQHLRLPRGVAAAIILFLLLGGTGLLVWLFVPALVTQMTALVNGIPSSVASAQAWLVESSSRYPFLKNVTESLNQTNLSAQVQSALAVVPKTLLGALGATTGFLNGLLLGALLLIMGFAVLVQPEPLIRGIMAAIPASYRDELTRALARTGVQLGAWLGATAITSLAMSLLVALALSVLNVVGVGVDNVFLFAVIAGVTQIIPVIGGLFGLLPPVLSSLGNPTHALIVGVVIFAVQQVVFQALSPIILSRSVSLHAASLLGGVLVFSGLFGFVGAFLAVPFLIILKSLYEEVYLPLAAHGAVSEADVRGVLRGRAPPEATPEQVGDS